MNEIQVLTREPWIERLGWTLLHFLWQGTAIAVLHTMIRFLPGRTLSPRARYALACAALLAMAIAPPLTFLTISNAGAASPQASFWALSAAEWQWLAPLAAALWVGGVFGFSVRLLFAFRFTHRLRATSHPTLPEWQRTLEQIAARMGRAAAGARPVRLMGSSLVNAPAVIGWLQPVILVPVAFLTGQPAEHIVALLAHEMAHIRRNDYIAGILQSIAEVALFYHPAVWWISGQIRAEREQCCDDMAIAAGTDVLTYARALAELESRRPGRLTPVLAANSGSLMDRIQRLIDPAHLGAHYLPGTGSVWAMILLWLVGAGVAAVPGAQKPIVLPSASLAGAFLPLHVNTISASPDPASTPLDSLVGQARRTLLYDPVFSGHLAQLQPPPRIGGAPAAGTAANRLVVETVTVKNGSGRAIEGLGKGDFAVTEDGAPQDISFFDFENVENAAASAQPARSVAAVQSLPGMPHSQIAVEPAGRLRYKDHRLLALYFDMTSMPVPDQLRALEAAQRFIGGQMSPADMLCVMQYTGAGVDVLQDFTGDRDRLLSIIATMAVGLTDTSAGASSDVFNTDRKLSALRMAATMLGSLQEKKSLVYFSRGLNLGGTDNQALLRATILDAVRSGVAIWPIDPRDTVSAPAATGPAATESAAFNSLGADTSGGSVPDSHDLAAGIGAAEKSIANYYIVGYAPKNATLDGRFRPVKVTLNNTADAKPDYRQGYFARKVPGAVTAGNTADDRERQLENALLTGDPATELTIAAEVNYFRVNNAEYFAPVTLKIPGSELVPAAGDEHGQTKKGGAGRTALDLIAEIRDEQGTIVAHIRDLMEIGLTDSTAEELAKRSITYNTAIVLLPGTYSIKMLARDSETGRIGTYLGRFAIPNLNRDDQHVPITSVVLSSPGSGDAAFSDQGGSAAAQAANPLTRTVSIYGGRGAAQIANPLLEGGQRVIPSVTRVFSARSNMGVYLQAFEKGATTTVPLAAHVTFYKGPVKVMETPVIRVSDGLDTKSKMLPIRLDVALASLKPGEYDCQVTVLDPATQKTALWQKPVTIIP